VLHSKNPSLVSVLASFVTPASVTHSNETTTYDLYILIAIHKGTRSCISHLLLKLASYAHLSKSYNAFIFSIDSLLVPKTVSEASSYPSYMEARGYDGTAIEWGVGFDIASHGKVVSCR